VTEARTTDAGAVFRDSPVPEGEPFRLVFVQHTERSSTAVARVRPGGGIKPHIHREHDEIITLLEGEAEFRIGDETRTVRAGETVSVPAGIVHAPFRSAGGCLFVTVFAPAFDPDAPDRHFVD
jgi:quercetin dioxygenase-like cupin family protein